ncbi:MAG: carboxyl transferase domain-containing protein, partial [Ketobacter sp.]
MPTWESTIDKNNESFQRNRAHLLELIESFQSIEQKAIDEAEKSRPKFEKRGRLLPRERIELLLDPGSEFLELMSLAGYQMHDDKDGSNSGGGVIAGIGYVAGIRCMISANNSAIKGGTISPAGLHKSLRLHEIIAQNKLPSITLSESGGANLNYAGEIFVEGARSFANQARLSAAGIPQITVVHGNATAGGAY